MFAKILVPLDGSEHSLRALNIAAQIADKFKGKLSLVHVYQVGVVPIVMPEPTTVTPPGVPVTTPMEVSRMTEAAREAGDRILKDAEENVKETGVEMEKLLVEGHVVQEIIRTAKEGGFDLIVIGARGISHIRELLLGSVTDGVIHHVSCPVLVVK